MLYPDLCYNEECYKWSALYNFLWENSPTLRGQLFKDKKWGLGVDYKPICLHTCIFMFVLKHIK